MKNRYLCSEAKTAILRAIGFVLMFESIFARVTKSQTIWAQGPQFGKYLKLNLTKILLLGWSMDVIRTLIYYVLLIIKIVILIVNYPRFIDQRMNRCCTAEGSSIFSWLDGSPNQFQSLQKSPNVQENFISSHSSELNFFFVLAPKSWVWLVEKRIILIVFLRKLIEIINFEGGFFLIIDL